MANTTISFTSDEAIFAMLTEAACHQYGYQPTIPDPANVGQTIPNTQTPQQFAQQVIVKFCKEVTTAYQVQKAAEAARAAATKAVTTAIDAAVINVTVS